MDVTLKVSNCFRVQSENIMSILLSKWCHIISLRYTYEDKVIEWIFPGKVILFYASDLNVPVSTNASLFQGFFHSAFHKLGILLDLYVLLENRTDPKSNSAQSSVLLI